MEKILGQRITTKLSIAVSLMDDFTEKEEVVGEVKVSIPALMLDAINNPSGYHNFLDVPDDTYTLWVKSEYYLHDNIEIRLPFYTIRLPFLFDHASGTPLTKMTPSSTVSAQISTPGASEGENSILMKNITDAFFIGDYFSIDDPDPVCSEFPQIDSPLPSDPDIEPFYLTSPLRFDHSADVPLKKMLSGTVNIAEIDGAGSGVSTGDSQIGLTNVTEVINVKDVLRTEDAAPECFQVIAPLINITLKPNNLYPFPANATLIRGSVKDSDGNPISGAKVELVVGTLKTRASENGGFVLYFPASHEDDSIQINVGDPPVTVNGEVRRGMTTSLPVTYT